MSKISFIIINLNTKELTEQAVQSVHQAFDSTADYEIILVDNHSEDGSKKFFSGREDLRYLYLDKNYGFSVANNRGVDIATGDYLYFLNNDAILHTSNLLPIVEKKFQEKDHLGAIATKVLWEDGTVQPNVQKFETPLTVLLRLLKFGEFVRNRKSLLNFFKHLPWKPAIVKEYLSNYQERCECYIDWASACSLIFSKEIFEDIGRFDENFFLYTEDEELCFRTHLKGYKILYTPEIVVTHLQGMSNAGKEIDSKIIRYKMESEFYFYKKHFPKSLWKTKVIYLTVTTFGFFFSAQFREMFKILMKNLFLSKMTK